VFPPFPRKAFPAKPVKKGIMAGKTVPARQISRKINELGGVKTPESRRRLHSVFLPDFLSVGHLIYYCCSICYYGPQPIILPGFKN